ncbi:MULTISPECIES: flagellar biosynthetic protein FliR [Suilimivivens]|jgi:flagellar biosynthetic protein fliR|uniref:Flagellar biosynthetic protein FliR n=2 Tax=Suilimivivens TaxID=2981640 RepID=A0ABT2T113_9FIRM|nr:flagellar biosynthetic protein FliR [Suilimivivens aceti]MCU6743637.1 flagellar biosynthetic protein FliR [Suilimivivens aceti]RHV51108.1 flagellar biosynthetic protein FliR [Lachnospiraceae bacterium OM04-12BH]SCH32189.1 Flagellar biosynthetic protein fliR [uncultured Clostridium sp.]
MIDYSFSYGDLELFLLIFVRVASFVYIAPFFSMSNTPSRVRVGLAFFISVLLYQTGPEQEAAYDTLTGYTIIVMKEAVTGFLIGFGANLCTAVVSFAGQIADMEMGLSMASLFDPATKQQTTITGVYYNYMVLLLLMISGMHRYLLKALAETYELIPINGAVFHDDALLQALITFMGDYIIVGFRICLPIFAVMIILNAVLGILAKVSPQLNMFAVGIQMKVLVGFCVLFVTTAMLPDAAGFIYEQMKRMVVSFVRVMSA